MASIKAVEGEESARSETRFFLVDGHDHATLEPIIMRHVMRGIMIPTDEWGAYRRLEQLGFIHQTMKHTDNFVDPIADVKTQLVEACWNRLRHDIVSTARSVKRENLPEQCLAAY